MQNRSMIRPIGLAQQQPLNNQNAQMLSNQNALPNPRQLNNQIANSPGQPKAIFQVKGVPSANSPLLQQKNDQFQVSQSLSNMDNINSFEASVKQQMQRINQQSNLQSRTSPAGFNVPQNQEIVQKNYAPQQPISQIQPIQRTPQVQRQGFQNLRPSTQQDVIKSCINPSIEQIPQQIEPQQEQKKKIIIQTSGYAPCPSCKQECQGQQILLSCKHCYHYECFYNLVKGKQEFRCVECNERYKRQGLRKYYENGKEALNQIYQDQFQELTKQLKKDYVLLQCERQLCEFVCISHLKASYCPLCLQNSRFKILQ
ncbi:hypothetical protein pb186bvf_007266 [Paramecium bursaria]